MPHPTNEVRSTQGDHMSNSAPQVGQEPTKIQNLFSNISGSYDLANDLMTFGLARSWRKKVVRLSEATTGQSVLDCATGTGDLAIEFKRSVGTSGYVIGSDFCKSMLDHAPQKAKTLGLDVHFELGDATALTYDDDQFDVCSIAYGIRNVSDPVKALSEMARVTKPCGRVMILETGKPQNPIMGPMIALHFKLFVPIVGWLTSGDHSAYNYLNQSSTQFPSGVDFLKLMEQTSAFSSTSSQSLMGGASYIYTGIVR